MTANLRDTFPLSGTRTKSDLNVYQIQSPYVCNLQNYMTLILGLFTHFKVLFPAARMTGFSAPHLHVHQDVRLP